MCKYVLVQDNKTAHINVGGGVPRIHEVDHARQAAREQFSRVSRLVQLKQFNSARLQLREGAASTLRKDLRDAQDLYITEEVCLLSWSYSLAAQLPALQDIFTCGHTHSKFPFLQMATASITALEQLDAALRAQDTTLCTTQLELLQQTLQQVIDALDVPNQTP